MVDSWADFFDMGWLNFDAKDYHINWAKKSKIRNFKIVLAWLQTQLNDQQGVTLIAEESVWNSTTNDKLNKWIFMPEIQAKFRGVHSSTWNRSINCLYVLLESDFASTLKWFWFFGVWCSNV